MKSARALSFSLALLGVGWAAARELEVAEDELVRLARKELATLPDYGVFDLLTLEVNERGLLTLGGYVHRPTLRDAAERAVKKLDGVREVDNRIEVLPVSTTDDDLRVEVYRAIYRDSYLSRYGTGDPQWLSSRPRTSPWAPGYRRQDAVRPPIGPGRTLPGNEPLGDHAIHIIVKNGRVLLAGVVDSQADRNAAQIKANGVFGVRTVQNELKVSPP